MSKAYKAMLDKITETLIAAKPVVKNYWANGDSLLESMRSSEVFVAMAWDAGGWKLHADNAAIDFKAPSEGALGWIDTFAIPAKAENVAAAYKWINFMMKPESCRILLFAGKVRHRLGKDALKFTDEAVSRQLRAFVPPGQSSTTSSGIRPCPPSWRAWKARFWTRSKPPTNLTRLTTIARGGEPDEAPRLIPYFSS